MHQHTILLVEDQALISMSIKRELEKMGYRVLITYSGEEAVEIAETSPEISLILMDIHLGQGMDGTEAATTILEKRDLPIIFLTSHTDPATIERVKQIKAYGFLTRSTGLTQLQVTIGMALRLFEENPPQKQITAATSRKAPDSSETHNNLLINSIQDSIYSYDRSGRFTSANRNLCHTLKREPDEIIGRTHAELGFPQHMCEEWDILHQKVYETGQAVISETQAPVHDGTIHDYEVTLLPMHDDSNNIVGIAGITKDITERKRSEEKIRANEAKLREIINLVPHFIFAKDEDGKFILANNAVAEVYGTTPNELIGKSDYDFNPDTDEVTHFIEDDRKVIESGKGLFSIEEEITDSKGVKRYLQTSKIPFTASGSKKRAVLGVSVDITEHKQVEQELRFQNVLLKTQLEVSPDGIIIVDNDDRIIAFNHQFADIWEIPERFLTLQLGERAMESVINKVANPDEFVNKIRHLYENRLEKSYEEIPMRDGRILERYSAPMFGSANEYYGRIWHYRDITDRKEAEAAIEKSLEEKNVLLSEIHHRVKNNMAVISSMLALQTEFGNQMKKPEALLQDLQTRILSMAWVHELVYETKNFAEIQSDLLLKRLAEYLKNTYKSKDKEITMQVRSDEVMLNMNNSVPLTLLIAEVLTNAWKHAFTGRNKGQIDLILEKQKKGFRLLISDDGVGVADLDKLNRPESFGYTIIHGLAGQLRGKLTLSSPDKGGLRIEALFTD